MTFAPPAPSARRGLSLWTMLLTGLLTCILLVSILINLWLGSLYAVSVLGPKETSYQSGNRNNRIVILPVRGLIDDEKAGFIRSSLQELRDTPPKAVILRVESGGGTVSASDRIAHLLNEYHTDTKLPIVASFGSMAASGGYYISAGADYIFAEPTTITGSIGVIAEAFTFSDSLKKLGVQPEVVTSTPAVHKDSLNPFRSWTDADRGVLRTILDHAHSRFVDIVYEGRKGKQLSREDVAALADGSIFTTDEALKNKLVDEEGFLEQAIAKAQKLANINPAITPEVTIMGPRHRFSLLGVLGADAPAGLRGVDADDVRRWEAELTALRLEYRAHP